MPPEGGIGYAVDARGVGLTSRDALDVARLAMCLDGGCKERLPMRDLGTATARKVHAGVRVSAVSGRSCILRLTPLISGRLYIGMLARPGRATSSVNIRKPRVEVRLGNLWQPKQASVSLPWFASGCVLPHHGLYGTSAIASASVC